MCKIRKLTFKLWFLSALWIYTSKTKDIIFADYMRNPTVAQKTKRDGQGLWCPAVCWFQEQLKGKQTATCSADIIPSSTVYWPSDRVDDTLNRSRLAWCHSQLISQGKNASVTPDKEGHLSTKLRNVSSWKNSSFFHSSYSWMPLDLWPLSRLPSLILVYVW